MDATNPANALDVIVERYDALADAEKVVADYILGHSVGAGLLSATQIAQLSGTSNATVSRFCRSLGYESFTQFRYALSTSTSAGSQPGLGDSPSSFPAYYGEAKSQELAETAAQLSYDRMKTAHELLVRAADVYVVGRGSSRWLAQDAAAKFRLAGLRSFADLTDEDLLHNSSRLTGNDVLFVLSTSQESEVLYEACEAARAGGANIVTVAFHPTPRLTGLSTVLLPAVSRDKIRMGTAGFSTISAAFVIEILAGWIFHTLENAVSNDVSTPADAE